MENVGRKYRFIIVGSGWRSMYYVRVAKALPHIFELCAMVCRTQEKAEKIAKEMGIHTTTSIEECASLSLDFVVVAVNKASIGDVSKEWMAKGFTVLCETPPYTEVEDLRELWRLHCDHGYRLCVAEQYFQYPSYRALLKVLECGSIGEPYSVDLSLAHDYHGASLIKKILHTEAETFSITGKRYMFPVQETASRYEQFTNGEIKQRARDRFTIEFSSGKVAFYDFSSEQYRSGIRGNYIKVQGEKGELQGMVGTYANRGDGAYTELHYIDETGLPVKKNVVLETRQLCTGDTNPNLNLVTEITSVKLDAEVLYAPDQRFGLCGLAEDETAVAHMMLGAATYHNGGEELYPLRDALTDAYMAGLMQKALENAGETIISEKQPWMENS